MPDEDDLRKAFLDEAKGIELEADTKLDHEIVSLDEDLRASLLSHAKVIGEKYAEAPQGSLKLKYRDQYQQVDRILGELKDVERIDNDHERAKAIALIKEEARTKFLHWGGKRTNREQEEHDLEKEWRQAEEKQKAGFGENRFNRIKGELNFLLNNYQQSNDNKIEQLIDQWRRSGDPAYDPAIKLKHRNVRSKKDQYNEPI